MQIKLKKPHGWYRVAIAGAAVLASVSAAGIAAASSQSINPTLPGYRLKFGTQFVASVVAPNGDNNPYGIAVVPLTSGTLTAGNILVADFNSASGAAGGGTSIMQVNPTTGVSTVFASGLPISGPVGISINPVNDGVWLGDFGSTDGSTSNVLLVLPNGTVKAKFSAATAPVTSGTQPTFDGVWGQGVSQLSTGQVSFYYGTTGSGVSGTGGGEVWRLDPHPTATTPNGQPLNATYVELATGLGDNATTNALPVTATNAAGPQSFAYDAATGTLYVTDGANNTIYAIPNAATATGPVVATALPVAAGVLNVPESIVIDPTTSQLYVVNAGNNTLVGINPTTGAFQGYGVLDRTAAGALFGLAAATETVGATSKTVLYYVDDNSNKLMKAMVTGRLQVGPHASKVVGTAIAGRTIALTILGSGFYGQPKITSSTGAETMAVVTRDSGTMLTVRVTVSPGTARGIHTFKIVLANGTSSSVRYNQA